MSVAIDRISFENYRQYGTGQIHFKTDGANKLSILIAKNGTGKTTLLNAITWCLYGRELHLAEGKKALPIVNSSLVHKAQAGEMIPVRVSVEISSEDENIEFSRTARFKVKKGENGNNVIDSPAALTVTITPRKGTFKNTVVKNGPDADIIVKQYFDETIFKFYFFDGEKLRDFFTESQANSIQQSIFNISQVTLLENAVIHLAKLNADRTKKVAKGVPDVQALDSEREKQECKLENAKATLELATDEITGCENERARLDEILRGYEPVKKLQEERAELEASYRKIENEVNTFQTRRTSFIRKYTVLITLYPRIKKALVLIQQKEKSGDLPPAIDKMQIKRLLEHPEDRCPICDGSIDESARAHLEKLLERIAVSSETSNYFKEIKGSLEMYMDQVAQFKGKLDELRQTEMDLTSQKERIEKRLKEIAGLLSNYNESGEHGTVNIAATEAQRTKIIKQINLAYQNAAAARATIQACENAIEEINKKQLDAIKKLVEYDDLRHEMEVIQMLHGNFKRIQIEIMQQMKNEIQTVTWKYFDEMIWKKNTFGRISINDSYDITVYNRDNIEMTGSLSATEQMALAYAFTLAIHSASGKNCPLVIDSPLGRVSDENRENMALALKDVSREKQIIMLFTPDEYSEQVKRIYDSVADVRELTLSADEKFVEGIEH